MKVSERIKQIRAIVKNGTNIEKELVQLEVEIVEALQVAKQYSYTEGYMEGLRMANLGKTGGVK